MLGHDAVGGGALGRTYTYVAVTEEQAQVLDRVQETTSTSGQGDYELAGASASKVDFLTAVGDGGVCYYAVEDDFDWEIGVGSVHVNSGTFLRREIILGSSNNGEPVDWDTASKRIFVTVPADVLAQSNSIDGHKVTVSETAPSDPEVGELWVDIG